MSLESGVTLCRLNHELLPDPGKPMARTTMPFGGRWGAAGIGAGGATSCAAPAGLSPSGSGYSAGWISSMGSATVPPVDPLGAKACATACSRPPPSRAAPPRPRPPRRRRPRASCCRVPVPGRLAGRSLANSSLAGAFMSASASLVPRVSSACSDITGVSRSVPGFCGSAGLLGCSTSK